MTNDTRSEMQDGVPVMEGQITTDAYAAWQAHIRRRGDLIREQNAAIVEANENLADLERDYTSALLRDEEVTGIEKKIEAVTRSISRHERILTGLQEYEDDGLEEGLVRAALAENGDTLKMGDDAMARVIAEIEALNERLWPLIEHYLQFRRMTKEQIALRNRILDGCGGKAYLPRVRDVGNRGRMERLNVRALPLVTVEAVLARYGRDAR